MTTIALTHKGIEYIMNPATNGCEGCAFNLEYLDCMAPKCVVSELDCPGHNIIWVKKKPECCGQPATCEKPCFHTSGRATEGRAGAIAGVPDYNQDDVAFKPEQVMFTPPADKASLLQATCNAEGVSLSELMADYAEQMMTTHGSDSAPGLLAEAAQTMLERGKQYDQSDGERSFEKAAKVFNAITGMEDYLSASDIALVLLAVKLVRDQSREEPHRDSLLDAVAYASLYGEERMKEGA